MEAVMQTYECLVKVGHAGAGRSMERSVRVRATDFLSALRIAKTLPGVKKGAQRFSGASVLRVSLVPA
jgi:hypothetical protein